MKSAQSVSSDTSTINPLKIIVDDLSPDSWRKVTLEYLDWVNKLMKQCDIHLDTYGEVFKILEYLDEHNAIELQNDEDCHLIRKR